MIRNKLFKYIPENEFKNKKLDLLAGLVEKILKFNELLNIPDLDSEESPAQRQQGRGLKILTPLESPVKSRKFTIHKNLKMK